MSALVPVPVADLPDHERRERDIPPAVRRQVLERDNHQCQSCGNAGENRLQLHHVIFRSQGGDHAQENLVTLCMECHSDLHAGFLNVAYIEWHPGQFSWFCARKRAPRRWQRFISNKKYT